MRHHLEEAPAPRRWSLRERPGYPEAYPTVGIGEADRELRQGRDHLLWRDHKGIISGAARASLDGTDAIVLTYMVEERDYLDGESGKLVLPLVWKGSQEDNQRPYARCPLCGRVVDVLVFVGVWCCVGTQHGLRHRSAVVAEEVRWTEELDDLENALAVAALTLGSTVRQVQRRDALLAKLGDKRLEANALLRVRMTREWVRPVVVGSVA